MRRRRPNHRRYPARSSASSHASRTRDGRRRTESIRLPSPAPEPRRRTPVRAHHTSQAAVQTPPLPRFGRSAATRSTLKLPATTILITSKSSDARGCGGRPRPRLDAQTAATALSPGARPRGPRRSARPGRPDPPPAPNRQPPLRPPSAPSTSPPSLTTTWRSQWPRCLLPRA